MKRLTTNLISFSKITTSATSISRNFTTQLTSSSSSISNSPIQKQYTHHNLKPCSNSNGLFYKPYKTQQLPKNPSQNYSTITPYFPSKQRKDNTHVGITPYFRPKQSKISMEFFEGEKSAEELIQDFKKMEATLDEGDISFVCMQIGIQLDKEGKDPEKIIFFANRALSVFDRRGENNCSLSVAIILKLLGSANYSLRKFDDALGFLNRANKILLKLENDDWYAAEEILPELLAVHMELANVHSDEGRIEDVVDNLRESLEINEFLLGKDSKEFGNANREFAEACVGFKKFKDGLPYCLEALEIHLGLLGENSVEVAHDRWVLGIIYTEMGEYEKALEENRLAQKIFKNCGCSSDLLHVVIDSANIHIALGSYEAAINMLKEHEKVLEENSENPLLLMTMGKALVHLEKFADAKGCLEIAFSVLEKNEKSKPLEVAESYIKIAEEYETMDEFETAISVLKRALALLEKLPEEQHLQGSVLSGIGILLLTTGKVAEAVPYLERGAETVKKSVGPKHFAVGYIYNNLGIAYMELERAESAAHMFAVAKDILDVSLGPHRESIRTCQNLSKAYAAMNSYPFAIELQQKAVDALESHGLGEEDELREARQLLEQLKASACATSSEDYSTKADLPQPSSPEQSG